MKKIIKLNLFLAICFIGISLSSFVFGATDPSVQTNSASNVSGNQATLNGYFSGSNSYNTYVWFQWGTTIGYGSTTPQQTFNYSGSFTQNIANLLPNTTYHFRAVAQGSSGTVYGQDMSFNSNGIGVGTTNNGVLTVTKNIIDSTSGNTNWQSSINANASDILTFAIGLQPNGQDIHNVYIKDIIPDGLLYKGNLMVNAVNYTGDITSGINIGTVYASQPTVISYQAQVQPTISYGSTTLTSSTTITSTEGGIQTSSAYVIATNSLVAGATSVSTGLTNIPIKDSFFLPVMLIILGSWFYFSGRAYSFADWLDAKIK
jgi:hypothetical protein